ncbi:cytochrome oxidase small assembly protein [Chitinasiproducens palmae]|nr:cytochrome oxidase small assembly protein [Chitinasiproducens palmae]
MTQDDRRTAGKRGQNLRMGLILLSIAAVFFVGVIVQHTLFG